jgi:hypothetical protein
LSLYTLEQGRGGAVDEGNARAFGVADAELSMFEIANEEGEANQPWPASLLGVFHIFSNSRLLPTSHSKLCKFLPKVEESVLGCATFGCDRKLAGVTLGWAVKLPAGLFG